MLRDYVRSTLAIVAVLLVIVTGAGGISAQAPSDKLTVVLIDGQSVAADPALDELVHSLLELLYHLKEGQEFAFVFTDDPATVYGPVETDAREFQDIHAEVEAKIASPADPTPLDLVPVMSELYNFLIGINAGDDTTIHVITANTDVLDAGVKLDRLTPIVGLFRDAGWSIFNHTVPGTDSGLLTVLHDIGDETGGESFELTVPDGLEHLADRILRLDVRGAMTSLGRTELSPGSVFEVDVDIVPGTSVFNMLLFREDSAASFRLRNPDGAEGSAGASLTELPHFVLWKLIDPVPGSWKLEVRGDSGLLTINRHSVNRFSIELQTYGAIPVGVPMTLVAAVLDAGARVSVDGIVTATVTDPSGTTIQYELTDRGVDGDSVASDGLFAKTIPPIGSEGSHAVELQLSWPDIDYSITTHSSFEARAFPTVTIKPEEVGIIKLGERTKVATVHVSIDGQPFSVKTDELSAAIATNDDGAGPLELVVQNFITADSAASYDIFYTPESESLATILVNLSLEYAGRPFQTASDSIVVSSVQPKPTPVPQVVMPAPTSAPPAPPPVAPEPPEKGPIVPIPLIVALAVLGVIILALVGYWLSKKAPFGYLYTEDGELVLDFSAIERTALNNLVHRNRVSGADLTEELPGFESVSFVFRRGEVSIETTEASSAMNVRVDNQPVTDQTVVYDNSLIGAQGRLYTFTMRSQTFVSP